MTLMHATGQKKDPLFKAVLCSVDALPEALPGLIAPGVVYVPGVCSFAIQGGKEKLDLLFVHLDRRSVTFSHGSKGDSYSSAVLQRNELEGR